MKFNEYLNKSFKLLKTPVLDSDKFRADMKKLFIAFYKKHDPTNEEKINGEYPFVIIEIKNNKATMSACVKDDRNVHIHSLIQKTLAHFSTFTFPDTKLYFWVSDRVPWELGSNMAKYPFYVFAAPKNINNIIFPDTTFECITLNKKYDGECWDWDRMKALFKRQSDAPKQKKIYFKGTRTTASIHRLRELLEQYAQNKEHMIIKLDGWKNYRPITDTLQYQFLLNLPGHYPWSNRFKYLFLTGAVIININVFTKSVNKEGWNEDEYHSFIDLIMKPDEDYINLSFTYYNAGLSKSQSEQNKARMMTNNEINRIISQIEDIYANYSINKAKYDKMIESYRKKINALSNETIYDYIRMCIVNNAKLIRG